MIVKQGQTDFVGWTADMMRLSTRLYRLPAHPNLPQDHEAGIERLHALPGGDGAIAALAELVLDFRKRPDAEWLVWAGRLVLRVDRALAAALAEPWAKPQAKPRVMARGAHPTRGQLSRGNGKPAAPLRRTRGPIGFVRGDGR